MYKMGVEAKTSTPILRKFPLTKIGNDLWAVPDSAVGYKRRKYRRYFADWMRIISSSSMSSSACRISSRSWAISRSSKG